MIGGMSWQSSIEYYRIINETVRTELGGLHSAKSLMVSESKQKYTDIIRRLVKEGAEGIILGCTEIGLLVKPEDSPVLLFDTTEIHAKAAVKYALADEMSQP
jgi:aspartate racemase